MYKVSIKELSDAFKLNNFSNEPDISEKFLSQPEINRPALQLAGFFDFFDAERLQIIGRVEYTYLQKMSASEREAILAKLFEQKIPCLVICRGLPVMPEMRELSRRFEIPVLGTNDLTSDFMGEVIRWLKVQLAPRISVHGVLVDVCGEGILIMGESGIGKSETALELVRRGHRLVADDSVEIKKVSNQTLIGSSPEIIRHLIELRGIGIIDAMRMFGVESVKAVHNIDLVIQLEARDDAQDYDRLGMDDEHIEILGNSVTCHRIPIRPGSNLALICESAAINHRLKKMGYNAAKALNERMNQDFGK